MTRTFSQPEQVLPAGAIDTLYSLAKRKAWNVDTALDWHQGVDTERFPFHRDGNCFAGFPDYDRLALPLQRRIAWQQHGQDIADILYGERAALDLVSRVIPAMEDESARLFLASQIFDEARHVEFFDRYLRLITNPVPGASPGLIDFLARATAEPDPLRQLLACQGVLEPLAMIRFRDLRSQSRIPLLRKALGYISADEARHTRFGKLYLEARLEALSDSRRLALAGEHSRLVNCISGDLTRYLEIGVTWGFDCHALLGHLRRRRLASPEAQRQLQWQQPERLAAGRAGRIQ